MNNRIYNRSNFSSYFNYSESIKAQQKNLLLTSIEATPFNPNQDDVDVDELIKKIINIINDGLIYQIFIERFIENNNHLNLKNLKIQMTMLSIAKYASGDNERFITWKNENFYSECLSCLFKLLYQPDNLDKFMRQLITESSVFGSIVKLIKEYLKHKNFDPCEIQKWMELLKQKLKKFLHGASLFFLDVECFQLAMRHIGMCDWMKEDIFKEITTSSESLFRILNQFYPHEKEQLQELDEKFSCQKLLDIAHQYGDNLVADLKEIVLKIREYIELQKAELIS